MRLACLALLLASCAPLTPGRDDPAADLRGLRTLEAIEVAAEGWDLAPDLLAAAAWHRSSFVLPDAADDHGPAGLGYLALSPGQAEEAAALLDVAPEELAEDPELALWAGAGWLAARGPAPSPGSPEDQWSAIVDLAGTGEPWLDDSFAEQVFRTLQDGALLRAPDGSSRQLATWDLPALADLEPAEAPGTESGAFSGGVPGYPGRARYLPAHANGNGGPRPSPIRRVVIHTIEGSYEGGIAWARSPSSNAGFQYIIRRSDGEVTQMVPDDVMGWHACNNNADTIGIEHDGSAGNPNNWTEAMLDSSARLTGWLTRRYGIPVDRDHIVGHGEIQPAGCAGRWDPGPHFPWADYMARVAWYKANGSQGDAAPDAEIFVDIPRSGQQVGNPFLTRVRAREVDHLDYWIGAYRVATDVRDFPATRPLAVVHPGWKKLKVVAYDAHGVRLAKKKLRVKVRPSVAAVAPVGSKLDGLDYLLSTEVTGEGATGVRYWSNRGRVLRDAVTDRLTARPAGFELVAGFQNEGSKLLLARAYRDGLLVGEGWSTLSVDDTPGEALGIHEITTLAIPPTLLRVEAAVDPGVAWVRYRVDGDAAYDAGTGEDRAEGPDFSMLLDFDEPGQHEVTARAFDVAGNLRGTLTEVVVAPSPTLLLEPTRVGPLRYHLDAVPPAGTERVVFTRGASPVPDAETGEAFTQAPAWRHEVQFGAAGPVTLSAVARDGLGGFLGGASLTLDVH